MIRPDVIDLTVKLALREDVDRNDITTSAVIPASKHIKAKIDVKETGVLCGIEIAEKVFRYVDENLRFLPCAKDGERVEAGREIAYIDGSAASILIAERTAINFLGHLSGIATRTREFVDKVQGTHAKIMDTRKTTPNLRILEKYAVSMGGGVNHRRGLYDQVLLKDNHLRILREVPIPEILATAKRKTLKKTIIGIEVRNLKELAEAFKGEPHYILLDNMDPAMVIEAVALRKKVGSKVPLEVSGSVSIDNVRAYADTGVERISVGEITHSSPWLDVSLDIVG